jgi:DNA-binding MarR family transcriptional regulator
MTFAPPAPPRSGGLIFYPSTDNNPENEVHIHLYSFTHCRRVAHGAAHAVAWAEKLGHPRAMASQRLSEDDSSGDPVTGKPSAGDDAPLKLENFLPYQLNVVANLTSLALSRVYARRYQIGVPEWRVLVTLGQYGVMTGKDIGAHTHMHKTKVSRAVALLEKRKLLLRRANRADMRESFLSLTAAGRAMYEELAPHALDFAKRLTEIFSSSDRDAFNRALKQLTERSAELVAEVAAQHDDDDTKGDL